MGPTAMVKAEASLNGTLYDGAEMIPLADGTACVVRKGKGDPVLLLHGIPLSLLTWHKNVDSLARAVSVIAADMKGFGMSRSTHDNYSLEGHAQFFLQLLSQLQIERVNVVGSSFGCAVALTMALKAPSSIGK